MRRLSFLLCALVLSMVLMAAPRSMQQAMTEAEHFLQKSPSAARRAPGQQQLQLAHTLRMPTATDDLAYVFSKGQDAGFVIVSADDCVKTILGYADEGEFDATAIPSNMQVWLEHYAEEIAYASSREVPSLKNKQAAAPMRGVQQTTAVSPLLGSIMWNQDTPYNNLCPMDGDNTRSYTGCVATAMAQIMRYWQYPTTGTGSHSYTWTNCNNAQRTLSANFGATTYDWANMKTSYSGSYTAAQATAVATLMYHVGVACDMNYGGETRGGSGSHETLAARALYTYFGYDAGVRALRPDYIGETAFENGVLAEIQAGRPVLLSGCTENYEGHAFVCDGVDNQNLFHINWGWGGYQNGYFALSALDPDDQGIGGAASGNGFHVEVSAIVGIQPDQGGEAPDYVEMGAQSFALTTKNRCLRTSRVGVELTNVMNLGFEVFDGYLGVLVADSTGTIYRWLDYDDMTASYGFTPSAYLPQATYSASLSNLNPGEYMLVPAFTNSGRDAYYRMSIMEEPKSLPFEVTNDSIFFKDVTSGPVDPPAPVLTDHWPYTQADIYYYPNLGNNFTLRLYSADAAFNNDGDELVRGYLMDLDINTEDPTSVVGTYLFDAAGTGDAGSLGGEYSGVYVPNSGYSISGGMVTIAFDPSRNYSIAYMLDLSDGRLVVDTVVLSQSSVQAYRSRNNTWRDYTLTNRHVTTTSIEKARTHALALTVGNRSWIPYLVRGVISDFNNTPAQIAQYGSAQYYISEDGTTANQLYCFRNYWLDNRRFTSGDEIGLGDTVVVYAPMMNYQGTPELYYGYIYEHTAAAPVETALDDVQTVGCEKMLRNGVLYIRREEAVYDVLGNKVQ